MSLLFTLASGWQNMIKYSEEFDNSEWTASNSSISASATRSPDGAVLGDELIENTATSIHFITQDATPISSGETHSFSIYVKPNTRERVRLQFGAGGPVVNFLLSGNGSVTTEALGGSGSIDLYSEGWYRCTVSGDSDATTENVYVILLNDSEQDNYAGDGSSSLYLWGSQVVEHTTVTPYVKTTSAIISNNLASSFLNLDIEYDYKLSGQKIEDVHRTKEGASYRYKWGGFDKIEFSIKYLLMDKTFVLNSWWNNNTDLLFSNNFTGDNFLVHITNKSTPIDKVEKPYIDRYKGKVILETYE